MDFAKCKAKGCPAPAMVKGLCLPCYQADRIEHLTAACKVEGCGRKAFCKGLCRGCYEKERSQRLARLGGHCSVCGSNRIHSGGKCFRCYQMGLRKGKGICMASHCYEKATGPGGLCAKHEKSLESRRQKKGV